MVTDARMFAIDGESLVQVILVIINLGLLLLVPLTLYFVIKWAIKKALREFYFEYRLEEQRSKEIREAAEKGNEKQFDKTL